MSDAQEYALDVRPTFVEELDSALAYIGEELCNPQAADRLLEDVYKAIYGTLADPCMTAPVFRPPDVAQPYYVIRVRKFEIYYVLRGKTMEVRWFRYGPSQQPLSANPAYARTSPYPDDE